MNLESSQTAFRHLFLETDPSVRDSFLTWVASSFPPPDDDKLENSTKILQEISADIRSLITTSGILASEAILPPPALDITHTVQIDAFLYDDDLMNKLFEAGKMAKYYCARCDARLIRPLNIMSHSLSIDRLSCIYNTLLPRLEGKTVIDVGSRFGAILFAGYVYSDAANLIGLEINFELCRIQQMVVEEKRMSDRVRIVHGDVMLHPEVIQSGHVVFLHNVFEFFVPKNEEIRCWEFLKANIRRVGTLIVAIPDIRVCLEKLKIDPDLFLDGWVEKLPLNEVFNEEDGLTDDTTLYRVI